MVIRKGSEKTERVVFPMTRIEHDNLVFARIVVVLVKGQQLIDAEVWEHAAYAIDKHVWPTILILDADMLDDTLMKELHKLRAMGITSIT